MRHISNYMNSKVLKTCLQTKKINELSPLLAKYLPDEINKNCQIGSFITGCLVLVVEDAVWSSQLRYLIPELRDKLRNEAKLYELSSIKIIINADIYAKNLSTKIDIESKVQKISPWSEILNFLTGT